MAHKTKQRGMTLLVMFTLMFSVVSSVFADAANPDTVDVDVNGQTVTLSGTWSWFTHPGSCTDRWVGWAVDWDDPNDPGTQVNGKDKNGALWFVGTQKDNTVHTNENCGSVVNGLRQGTWGDISHTYTEPGTYHACVLMYDIHLEDGQPKKASEMVAGGGADGEGHNKDNSAETNGLAPGGAEGADCIPAEIIIPSTPTLATHAKYLGDPPPAGGIPLGSTVTDRATLGETGGNGAVTGEVDFFICGPTAAPANCNAGTSAGANKTISNGVANSNGVGLASSGWYCFRAEYDSDTPKYNDTSHTNATTECVYVKPTITVLKTATPTTIAEPGGAITFTVEITNNGGPNGVADVSITTLSDDKFGNIDGIGTCDVPQTIAAGATYSCTFAGPVTGNAGFVHTDVVTASGKDSNDNNVSDTDDATVTITNLPPIITTLKVANPTTLPEPGGNVTFTVTVTNTSGVDPETITSLNDSVFGVLVGDADCHVGTVLPIGGSCSFDFVGAVNGNAGFEHTNIATVCATDDDGSAPFCIGDPATVTITNVASTINVTKDAAPTSISEPGGDITFTVVVTNTSTVDSLTISKLDDNVYGPLAGDADCQIGTVLAPAGSCTFSFTEAVSGNAGSQHTDTVEACGTDNDQAEPCDTDDATVTVTNVSPVIATLKAANPETLPEPGGLVTFTVTVTNTSLVDPETITSLNDSVFGPLVGDADCHVGTVLPIGGSCSFDFQGQVTGNAGFEHTNVATVCATDDDGSLETCDGDDATVLITDLESTISVDKTADPTSLAEPGGNVTFHVIVSNTSASDALTITKLEDDVYGVLAGDADCMVGTILGPGTQCSFDFVEAVSGNAGSEHTDIVEACGIDDDQNAPCDTDDAVVTITDVTSTIQVVKEATPTTITEPGGNITFAVEVTNTSTVDTLTITKLEDNVYGPLVGDADCHVGTVLGPLQSCAFNFVGAVSGNAGSEHTDIVEACGVDDDQNAPCDFDDAKVTITDVEPVIATIKAANPETLPEPGGMVTYTVTVTNNSLADSVMITSLEDNKFGLLVGDADCQIGTVLAKGDSCSFDFQGEVLGNAGFEHINVAEVCVVDDDGTADCDDDDATVTITNVAPTIEVTKTASSNTVSVGDPVTFTVTVTNTSVEPVTISSLNDSIYGNLATRPASTCGDLIGDVLGIGASTSCTFVAIATVSETNVVTVCVADDDENEKCETDDEHVDVLNPGIRIAKVPDASGVVAGQPIGFRIILFNAGLGNATGIKLRDLLPDDVGLNWTIAPSGVGLGWDGPGGGGCAIVLNTLRCGGDTGVNVPGGLSQEASIFTVHILSTTTAATAANSPVENEACVESSNEPQVCAQADVDVFALTVDKTNSAPVRNIELPGGGFIDIKTQDEGKLVTYTLTYDLGASTVHDVDLVDVLPAGLTFQASPAPTSSNPELTFVSAVGQTLTWHANALSGDGTVTYVAKVDVGASKIGELVNHATIDSDETPADTAESTVFVPAPPQIATHVVTGPPTDVLPTQGESGPGSSMMVILAALGLLVIAIGFVTPAPAAVRRRNHRR